MSTDADRRPSEIHLDASLYAGSAAFAVLVWIFASIPIHREWAQVAVWPYAAGAAASLVMARAGAGRRARALLAAVVLAGAALLPLALEAWWRSRSDPGLHAQSEAIVTEEAAKALMDGANPYAASYARGPLAARPLGTKTHFPYLPGMLVFGLPRASDGDHPGADARVAFALFTLGTAGLALRWWSAPAGAKLRAFQFLVVLPTGALLMSTGGDDLPVLALLLLALVLAREQRTMGAGIALGLAAATKQTSWILIPFLLMAVSRGQGRRAAGRVAASAAAVAAPIIAAFLVWNPSAFWEDAVLFPLGLGTQPTPAATPTLGSVLVDAAPGAKGWMTVGIAVVVAAVALYLLIGRPPDSVAGAARRTAVVFLAAFVLGPAARLGYLVYPIDLFVWGGLLAVPTLQITMGSSARPADALRPPSDTRDAPR